MLETSQKNYSHASHPALQRLLPMDYCPLYVDWAHMRTDQLGLLVDCIFQGNVLQNWARSVLVHHIFQGFVLGFFPEA